MKKVLIVSIVFSSIVLSGCGIQKSPAKGVQNSSDMSVQSCINQGGTVSSELTSYKNMSSGELQQKLASGTLEMEMVCPEGKQKIFDIVLQQGDTEQQICCK